MFLIEQFSGVRILCVGDVMVDHFVHGVIERISPESPVPVLLAGKTATHPGGAANVARNIAALGGRCTLAGIIGKDAAGETLMTELDVITGIRTSFVVSPARKTTQKKRFVAQGQQVLRVDDEDSDPASAADAASLMAIIAREISGHDVLLLSDYAKGVLTDEIVQKAIALALEIKIPVIVDPKSPNLARYRGATIVTPNSREIIAATGMDPSAGDAAAADAATQGMEQAASQALLLTRAEKGMTLVCRDNPPVHIASQVREVFDVAGAGDTVAATLALALGAGANFADAARLANLAAGIAVGRRGTSTVSQSDLLAAQARNTGSGAANVLDAAQLKGRLEIWKRDGLKIGFTNGCFDILHVGHIRLLEFARRNCDRLIVATNSDASVRKLKGAGRPINGETDRAELLASLAMVDAVIVFDADTPQALIESLAPDLLVKGADYATDQIVGADFVTGRGGRVLRFALVPDKSSTKVIEKAGSQRASD